MALMAKGKAGGLKPKRNGTLVPKTSTAIVADRQGELSFLLADIPDDVPLPRNVMLLVAVLLLAKDEAWVEQTIALSDSRDPSRVKQ